MSDAGFSCGTAAQWLPRTLGAAALTSTLLVAFRFTGEGGPPFAAQFQLFLMLVGVALGFWLVKSGAEVRIRLRFDGAQMRLAYGRRSAVLELDKIERFEYAAPFAAGRRWLPAMQIIDLEARCWRIPTVLDDGTGCLGEILTRASRNDLEAWAESLHLEARMARGPLHIRVGYGVAAAMLIGAGIYYLH